MIDFLSPKSAKLGSQHLPKWSQIEPNLIQNMVLSKSKNHSKTLALRAKMKVGESQDGLLGIFLPFQNGIKNKINVWIDF